MTRRPPPAGRTPRSRRRPAVAGPIAALLVVAVALPLVAACNAASGGGAVPAAGSAAAQTAAAPAASPATAAPAVATPADAATPTATPDPDAWLLTLVSKQFALAAGFVPADLVTLPARWVAPGYGAQQLVRPAADALGALFDAAHAQGLDLRVRSSYRSYATQQRTFAYWVAQHGLAQAERESARAGHSEHQLGTTVDLTSASVAWDLDAAFGEAPEGRWLAAHAWAYGFALSYPRGKEAITGYEYEPWHIRYIGRTHAAAWHASGLTLIEYLERVHGQDAATR